MHTHLLRTITIGTLVLSSITCGYAKHDREPDLKQTIHYLENKLNAEAGPYEISELIKDKDKHPYDEVIDVRSAEEFAKGHVPGAVNIPNGILEGNMADQLTKKGINYIYCYNLTCHLAARVALEWAKKGYPVKEMVGGFTTWKDSGFPVEPNETECKKD